MKVHRGHERDLKLDIARAQAINDKLCDEYEYPRTPGYHIESSKRFMSLLCRTFPCNLAERKVEKTSESDAKVNTVDNINQECVSDKCPKSRVEFYDTLKLLIRMGSERHCERNPRRVVS